MKCKECNKEIELKATNQQFCLSRCRSNFNARIYRTRNRDLINQRAREYRQKNKETLQAKWRKYPKISEIVKICEYCKNEFHPQSRYHPTQRFCSIKCRANANARRYRQKHKEELQGKWRKYSDNLISFCKVCGKEFKPHKFVPNQKFCSALCREKDRYQRYEKSRQKAKKCKYCGRFFYPTIGLLSYCSSRCREMQYEKEHPLVKKCKYCSKEIKREKGLRKDYCSNACRQKYYYNKYSRLLGRVNIRGNYRICPTCGNKFELKAINQIYCSKKCWKPDINICNVCGLEKPIYGKGMCNSCWKKQWRLNKNPPKIKTCKYCKKQFKSRIENKEYCSRLCFFKAYRDYESRRAYLSSPTTKKRNLERYKKWRKENLDKTREWTKRYSQTPKGKKVKLLSSWKRRSKIKGFITKVNASQLLKIEERDKVCVYCGKLKNKMTFDHIVPIDKDGKDEFNNLVLSCGTCNFSKHTKTLKDWLMSDYCIENNITKTSIKPVVWRLLNNQKEQKNVLEFKAGSE